MPLRRAPPTDIGAAVLLACLAGAVDAVGFLNLGGLFVSFMSGNTTRFGVYLASGNLTRAGAAIGIIVAFVAGAALGSGLGTLSAGWRRTVVVLAEAALLTGAATASRVGLEAAGTALMAMAMGVENAVFVNDEGETVINLTFMTGALVKVGEGLAKAVLGGPRWSWWPFLLLWISLAAGALGGAASYDRYGLGVLYVLSACLVLIAAGFAWPQWRALTTPMQQDPQ